MLKMPMADDCCLRNCSERCGCSLGWWQGHFESIRNFLGLSTSTTVCYFHNYSLAVSAQLRAPAGLNSARLSSSMLMYICAKAVVSYIVQYMFFFPISSCGFSFKCVQSAFGWKLSTTLTHMGSLELRPRSPSRVSFLSNPTRFILSS